MAEIERLNVCVKDGHHIIGVGRSKFYQLINRGEIPVIKLGRRTLVPVSALRAFVARKMEEAAK